MTHLAFAVRCVFVYNTAMIVRIEKGETLWDSLKKKNIVIDRPCGGNGCCGQCAVEVAGVGKVKSCCFDKPGEYDVLLEKDREFFVVGSDESNQEDLSVTATGDYLAIDVGTTTVALSGVIAGRKYEASFVNPQRQYGADVISRVKKANEGGLEELQALITDKLLDEISDVISDKNDVWITVAANTAMNHFMRGLECNGLAKAPFETVANSYYKGKWKTLGANGKEVDVHYLPGVGAFVGGDIVSGMYGLGMNEDEKITLLVDLGTNGEMVIGKKGDFLATSAAAGPAFESSDLARQIHASGIISILYEMRKRGIMDEYGTLSDDYFEEGYPFFENGKQVAVITQDDIREIQMAKAAVRAGIEILIREYGVSTKDISKVYLAGGMGYFIDTKKALSIGLFPEELCDIEGDIEVVGNSSLEGAIKASSIRTSEDEFGKIVASTKEINLSEQKGFEDLYISYMNF